jgi:hypothetical protein
MKSRYLSCSPRLFLAIICLLLPSLLFSQGSIIGRVWGPLNTPVGNGYVFVTNENVDKLYGEAITLVSKEGSNAPGSFRIDNLPANIKIKVFAFHDEIPSSYGYQEISLKNNESLRLVLDISLSFKDPGFIKNPLERLPVLLKQAILFESADEVIARLSALKNQNNQNTTKPYKDKLETKVPSDWSYELPIDGYEMTFNGYSDFFKAPSKVITSSDFSFEIVLMNYSTGQDATIFSNQNDNDQCGLIFHGNSNGFLIITGSGKGRQWTNDNYFNIPGNRWMHYIFVRHNNTHYLYENNTLKYTQTHTTDVSFVNANLLTFARFPAGPARFWNGKIRIARFWNRALTEEEVNALFQY